MIIGARVENGSAVLLNERGLAVRNVGQQVVCAGVSGDDLVYVTKQGNVYKGKIRGDGNSVENVLGMGGKAYDAVSMSMGGGLNFSITCSDGTVHYWANGQKTRTDTSNRIIPTQQAPERQKEQSSESEPTVVYADVPDGFMAGLGHRCKVLINEPIPGPWAKIVVWLTAISTVIGIITVLLLAGQLESNQLLTALGILAINAGVCYWIRNAIAKVLVRSWYGAPIVIIGALISQTNPEIGGLIVLGGVIAWFWPIWPIALIAITVVGLVMMAIGKSTPTMGDRR